MIAAFMCAGSLGCVHEGVSLRPYVWCWHCRCFPYMSAIMSSQATGRKFSPLDLLPETPSSCPAHLARRRERCCLLRWPTGCGSLSISSTACRMRISARSARCPTSSSTSSRGRTAQPLHCSGTSPSKISLCHCCPSSTRDPPPPRRPILISSATTGSSEAHDGQRHEAAPTV